MSNQTFGSSNILFDIRPLCPYILARVDSRSSRAFPAPGQGSVDGRIFLFLSFQEEL